MAVLQFTGVQPAVTDHQPVRDTNQFRIRKLDPGAGITVVELP